jgi:hypothetical protein
LKKRATVICRRGKRILLVTYSVEVDFAGRDPEAWRTSLGRCASRTQGRNAAFREISQVPLRRPWKAETSSRVRLRNLKPRQSSPEQRNIQMPLGSPRRPPKPYDQWTDDRHRKAHGSTSQEVAQSSAWLPVILRKSRRSVAFGCPNARCDWLSSTDSQFAVETNLENVQIAVDTRAVTVQFYA